MPKAKSIDQFIADARKVHGDRYDYSKVVYVNSSTKVCIICPKHGEFWQTPGNHLSGKGCMACRSESIRNQQTKTTDQFINEAQRIHGDQYDYSKVKYISGKTKVCIVCREHGEFWQGPTDHLQGRGCPQCKLNVVSEKTRLPQTEFIRRAKEVHGEKYDYSKVKYITNRDKVCIICPEHGEFWQTPGHHINQQNGCPKCKSAKAYLTRQKNKGDMRTEKNPKVVRSFKHIRTTADFIQVAREVHGDRFNYDEVDLVRLNDKIRISCKVHGVFLQRALDHLKGCGCYACSGKMPLTQDQFIERVRQVHGNKYDLSKVVYRNSSQKITLICPTHGEFTIVAGNVIHAGQGCAKCANEANGVRQRMTTDEFVRRATEVHGSRFKYDQTQYVDSKTKVAITCREHGVFFQHPSNHLRGSICPKCSAAENGLKESISLEDFIARSRECHKTNYDYSLVRIDGVFKPVQIICPHHGVFKQTPQAHLRGSDCPICARKAVGEQLKKTLDEFIADAIKVHGNKYDYSHVEYKSANEKVAIRCVTHNRIFWQTPAGHVYGYGCPQCSQSHLEEDIMSALIRRNIQFVPEKTFDWLRYRGNLFLDFFLPEYGVAIECQGLQHFQVSDYYGGMANFELTTKRDRLKKELCEKHGIHIIYYTNVDVETPYFVFRDKERLFAAIQNKEFADSTLWKDPELPLNF